MVSPLKAPFKDGQGHGDGEGEGEGEGEGVENNGGNGVECRSEALHGVADD